MALFVEPTSEQRAAYRKWVKSRPPAVRRVAECFDPWTLYRMKGTGQRVTLRSFSESKDKPVTMSVNVSGQFNYVAFDRYVFGVDPAELEPCDLPAADETLGTALTEEGEIQAFVDAVKQRGQ